MENKAALGQESEASYSYRTVLHFHQVCRWYSHRVTSTAGLPRQRSHSLHLHQSAFYSACPTVQHSAAAGGPQGCACPQWWASAGKRGGCCCAAHAPHPGTPALLQRWHATRMRDICHGLNLGTTCRQMQTSTCEQGRQHNSTLEASRERSTRDQGVVTSALY